LKANDIERFLTKRGFKVLKITEANNGFLVELKSRANEAVEIFSNMNEQTPIIFKEKVSLWGKINASIQRSILHR
jgi:hypothetical protein